MEPHAPESSNVIAYRSRRQIQIGRWPLSWVAAKLLLSISYLSLMVAATLLAIDVWMGRTNAFPRALEWFGLWMVMLSFTTALFSLVVLGRGQKKAAIGSLIASSVIGLIMLFLPRLLI